MTNIGPRRDLNPVPHNQRFKTRWSKSCILPPTNWRVIQPVIWRDRPITAVNQLVFKSGGRIRDLVFHDGGFKHTAQKAEHISIGSVLALTLVAGRSNGCFFMVQQPCPGSLSPGLLANACTITYLTRWKERGTIRFIPELVHNLASALALRAPLATRLGADEVITITVLPNISLLVAL